MRRLPRYPIYVVSKGRADNAMTARFLGRDRVPFRVVVEPQEADAYASRVGAERVLVLPFSNLGKGSYPARNWIWEHARESGAARHWILDDNIGQIRRLYGGKRIPADSGPAFASVEDFVDRYENVAVAGMNYQMFVTPTSPPYRENCHVYSILLIQNDLEHRWRLRYNEDTDLCLQVLDAGLCTVLVNLFMADKKTTMTMKGGNSDELYAGDGRLRMARTLEKTWPGIVSVDWRWGRAQHVVNWAAFRTPLKMRADVDLEELRGRGPDEYQSELRALAPLRSPELAALLDAYRARRESTASAAHTPVSRAERASVGERRG